MFCQTYIRFIFIMHLFDNIDREQHQMEVLTTRANSCKLFRSINRSILMKYLQLKSEFQRFLPPNNQILSTFKSWKTRFRNIIEAQICNLKYQLDIDINIDQQVLIQSMIELHKHDQQFNELFKNLNSSIETIKDFIRTLSIKDPSTEIYIN